MNTVPLWFANAVAVAAGIASMWSFVPQIVKIMRERHAEGVSLRMFAVTVSAFALWTAYGAMIGSWPIAVCNAVCFMLASTIVALRLRYGERHAH